MYSTTMSAPKGWGSFTLGNGDQGKDITVYGASWCPHCHNEMSKLKGTGATFVDCSDADNQKLCQSKNIRAFPTIYKGDKHVEGEASLEQLLAL